MKNVFELILILFLSSGLSFANKYETAMVSAINKLNTAKNPEDYLAATLTFERIGAAEESEWLPYYYASFGCIQISHTTHIGEEKDSYLDKAKVFIDQAGKLSTDNDEIVTMLGYIYMMKVVVDPMTRGPEYGARAIQEFGKAVGMNENNPRALLLLARMQMGMDQFMGNDVSESCEIIKMANKLFDDQKPGNPIMPQWGKEMANIFEQECNSNSK